jgi:hypothetical protein
VTDERKLEKLREWQAKRADTRAITGSTRAPELDNALLNYVVRCLGRGFVPDLGMMLRVASGELPVPPCGHIGCPTPEEHVHG